MGPGSGKDTTDPGRPDDDDSIMRGDWEGPGDEDRWQLTAEEAGSQSTSPYTPDGGMEPTAAPSMQPAAAVQSDRTRHDARSDGGRHDDIRTSASHSASESDMKCDPH